MLELRGHHSNLHNSFQIGFEIQLFEKKGLIRFKVSRQDKLEWHTSSHFSAGPRGNWGLWNYDVVEVFLMPAKQTSYQYQEIQVSPLNQTFALNIISPRKVFYSPLKTEYRTRVRQSENIWTSEIEVNQSIKNYQIGAFACLGETREFYSLNPNLEENPDFHRPELFLRVNKL